MGNSKIDHYYSVLAEKATCQNVTRNKATDSSVLDSTLVLKYADKEKALLDLGSGTGLLVNRLFGFYKSITAVEKYIGFSKFIDYRKGINIINQDMLDPWQIEGKFEVITLFGVMNFFSKKEAENVYNMAYSFLKDNGIIIVKNQFGIECDVSVDGFSEELQTYYYSEYRHIKSEKKLLDVAGLHIKDVVDIYPADYNRWDNTHFYALICGKNAKKQC